MTDEEIAIEYKRITDQYVREVNMLAAKVRERQPCNPNYYIYMKPMSQTSAP